VGDEGVGSKEDFVSSWDREFHYIDSKCYTLLSFYYGLSVVGILGLFRYSEKLET
jgi:hypothetical protein